MTDAPLAGRLECLALRARVLDAVREHFREQGFLEVDTPLLVRSPGVEVHLEPFVVPTRAGDLYLNTSPEYHMKRLLAAGAKEIFQLARAFRAGEAGDRHNPEFTLLEWYRPGGDHLAMLDDPQRAAPARRQTSKRGQETLVQRERAPPLAQTLSPLRLHPSPLLLRVRELRKGVGQLQARRVDLQAVRHGRVVR